MKKLTNTEENSILFMLKLLLCTKPPNPEIICPYIINYYNIYIHIYKILAESSHYNTSCLYKMIHCQVYQKISTLIIYVPTTWNKFPMDLNYKLLLINAHFLN